MVFYGVYLLLSVADDLGYKGPSYEKLIRLVMKKKWIVNLAKVMMILLQLFKVVGNNIFIVEVMVHIFCNQGFSAQYCKPRSFYVLMSFIISAPTYLILNISFYSYISLGSVLTACAMILALFYQSVHELFLTRTIAPQLQPQPLKAFMTFSLICHGLQGIGMIMPIRSSMENIEQFRPVQKWTTLFVGTIYFATSVILALAFGNKLKPIVVLTFSKDYIVIFTLTIIYGLVIFMTYPLHLFPIYTIIVNTSQSKRFIAQAEDQVSKTRRTKLVLYLSRLVCLFSIYAIVLLAPNFVPFLSLVGAVFASTFLFIFPVLLYNRHFKDRELLSRGSEACNWLFLLLVMGASGYSAIDSIRNMFSRGYW